MARHGEPVSDRWVPHPGIRASPVLRGYHFSGLSGLPITSVLVLRMKTGTTTRRSRVQSYARAPHDTTAGRTRCVGQSTRMPSSLSWRGATVSGASVSGQEPELVLGNAMTSRIEWPPASDHDEPVEPERDAAVRRRAVRERLEQEPELLARLLVEPCP